MKDNKGRFYKKQGEIVVAQLVKNNGYSRENAINLWYNSETKRIIQDEYKLSHISGARCYDELIMEITKDPLWLRGSFD